MIKDMFMNILFCGFPFVSRISGHSMYPTLSDGDYVLLNPFARRFASGDIVTAKVDNEIIVKRVIGTGGDNITITNTGEVSVNGEKLSEPYICRTSGAKTYCVTVPENHIWLMGDNRGASTDSRTFGAVSVYDVTGKIIKRRIKQLWKRF